METTMNTAAEKEIVVSYVVKASGRLIRVAYQNEKAWRREEEQCSWLAECRMFAGLEKRFPVTHR